VKGVLISDFGGVLTTPLLAGFLAYQEEAGVSLEELGGGKGRANEGGGDQPAPPRSTATIRCSRWSAASSPRPSSAT
jgi:hypothetical protein